VSQSQAQIPSSRPRNPLILKGFYAGSRTPETDQLDALLGNEPVVTGDLIMAQLLQSFSGVRDLNRGMKLPTSLLILELFGADIAIQAANVGKAVRSPMCSMNGSKSLSL
jgi:hypothetical protein